MPMPLNKVIRGLREIRVGHLLFMMLAYSSCAYLSLSFSVAPLNVTLFWVPGGVALAAYLLLPRRLWPLMFSLLLFTDFVVQNNTQNGGGVRLLYALVHAAEGMISAWLLTRVLGHIPRMVKFKDVLAFILVPLLGVYPLTSLILAGTLRLLQGLAFWSTYLQLWSGYIVGLALVGPIILSWGQQPAIFKDRWPWPRIREACLLFAVLIGVTLSVFSRPPLDLGADLNYLIYPLWLLIAVRLGPRGNSLAALIVSVITFWCSVKGLGPFSMRVHPVEQSTFIVLFIFLGVGVHSALLLGALIYDKTRAQRALRESQALLEALVANIPAAIHVKNMGGRYLVANRYFEEMMSVAEGHVVGLTDFDIMSAGKAKCRHEHDMEILKGGQLVQFEEDLQVQDRKMSFLSIKFPLYQSLGGSLVICGISTDITHLKAMESERASLFEREKHARREAEALFQEAHRLNRLKDEFLMTLSHELRMPLHGILGWTQILSDRHVSGEQKEIAFDNLKRSVEAESRVIDELLDISRILAQKIEINLETCRIDCIVESAILAVDKGAVEKGIDITLESDDEAHVIRCDKQRLEQILINILVNAIKFTPQAGHVLVRVGASGSEVKVCIQDSGIGIAPDVLPHIFKRFWQADSSLSRSYGGLGLGLALVQELVALHGGTIQAESPGKGEGATFTVVLPLAELQRLPTVVQDFIADEAEELAPLVFDLRKLRLLAIDDDLATCKLLHILLSQEFEEVRTAISAADAMDVLEQWQPDFILCDIAMPGEDGLSFIRRARKFAHDAQWSFHAAALSANADENNVRSALREGFEAFLTKPVNPQKIVDVIRCLLSQQSPTTERPLSWLASQLPEARSALL